MPLIYFFVIIIITLIAMSFGALIVHSRSAKIVDYIGASFFFGMVGVLVSLFIASITNSIVSGAVAKNEVVDYYVPIYALQDNIGTNGRIFIGSGQIDSDMYYFYMIKKNGGMVTRKINAEDNILVETNDSTARIVRMKYEFKNKKLDKWFDVEGTPPSRIEVPKGSVAYNYNVDLQ